MKPIYEPSAKCWFLEKRLLQSWFSGGDVIYTDRLLFKKTPTFVKATKQKRKNKTKIKQKNKRGRRQNKKKTESDVVK